VGHADLCEPDRSAYSSRLAWGAAYRNEAEFESGGRRQRIVWRYTTRSLDAPMLEARGQGERIEIGNGRENVLYVPSPNRVEPFFQGFAYETRSRSKSFAVKIEPVDPDTARVRVGGDAGGQIALSSGRRSLVLVVAPSARDDSSASG
jgi:hypothetical protein